MVVSTLVNGAVFLIEELGIFAVGATVVGWVTRKFISQYFDKELSKYQAEIDKELSRYQTELEKEKLQFSELHNERAKITAELYEKFVLFEEDLRSLTHPMEQAGDPPESDVYEDATKSGNEFLNFYMKNKIYFPEEICETIEDIIDESMEIHNKKGLRMKKFAQFETDRESFEKEIEFWNRVAEDDIPELKRELESHFRGLLGVDGSLSEN